MAYSRHTFLAMKKVAAKHRFNTIGDDNDSLFLKEEGEKQWDASDASKETAGEKTVSNSLTTLISECHQKLGVGLTHVKAYSRFIIVKKKRSMGIDSKTGKEDVKWWKVRRAIGCHR
jgi:DNA polymerase elongation subunit (family B)